MNPKSESTETLRDAIYGLRKRSISLSSLSETIEGEVFGYRPSPECSEKLNDQSLASILCETEAILAEAESTLSRTVSRLGTRAPQANDGPKSTYRTA